MKNKKILAITILILLVLIIYGLIVIQKIQNFDNAVYNIISKFISEPVTVIAKVITTMGSAYVIIPATIISAILFWKKEYGKLILINLCVLILINQGIKFIIKRPRPEVIRLIAEKGYSFPSGHSMISMAFYGFMIYIIYTNVKNNYLKWGLITSLTIIILLIGLSRIYLGVHYASDVLAGFLISIAYLILISMNLKTNNYKHEN